MAIWSRPARKLRAPFPRGSGNPRPAACRRRVAKAERPELIATQTPILAKAMVEAPREELEIASKLGLLFFFLFK